MYVHSITLSHGSSGVPRVAITPLIFLNECPQKKSSHISEHIVPKKSSLHGQWLNNMNESNKVSLQTTLPSASLPLLKVSDTQQHHLGSPDRGVNILDKNITLSPASSLVLECWFPQDDATLMKKPKPVGALEA
jgi:hypothetical protein